MGSRFNKRIKIYKGVSVLGLIIVIGSFIGCGQKEENKTTNTTQVKQETKTKDQFKFPEGQSQTGKGKIYVSTSGGTSENGNVPVILVKKDTSLTQIELDAESFDGSKVSYIYINKKFLDKKQLGDRTQTSLDLKEDLLKPGEYTVSVVQFENDDTNGKVTQFIETKYQIKN